LPQTRIHFKLSSNIIWVGQIYEEGFFFPSNYSNHFIVLL